MTFEELDALAVRLAARRKDSHPGLVGLILAAAAIIVRDWAEVKRPR